MLQRLSYYGWSTKQDSNQRNLNMIFLSRTYVFVLMIATQFFPRQSAASGLCWTKWINKYRAAEGIDNEVLSSSDAFIYGVCPKPLAVDVARLDGLQVKEKLNCEFFGCLCRDINQRPGVKCADYKVRFLCPCLFVYKGKEQSPKTALLCNGASGQSFHCPIDKVISIQSAYYGSIWLSKCGIGLLNTVCRKESTDVLRAVRKICDGKRSCTVSGPPHKYGGPDCGIVQKHLHLEVTCAESCIRNGKTYYTGHEVIDKNCKTRCTCVTGGRFVCLSLCPVKYGVVCPNGGVVRLRRKQVSTTPKCSCLVPTCFSAKIRGCFKAGKSYKAGEKFHRNCKDDCQCIGQKRIFCKPLCETKKIRCAQNQVIKYIETATAYESCKCKEPVCSDESS